MSRTLALHVSLIVVTLTGLAVTPVIAGPDDPHHKMDAHSQADKPSLPKCPVMGDPVDFSVKTMTKDGPVYFCCPMCIEKYKKTPDKYADEVKEQRKALAKLPKVQVTCPVSGEPVDSKVSIEQKDGKKVYFCCKDCVKKYEADPSKYAASLAGSYTYQTRCPVMGETIDPKAFIKLKTGETIYFCCKGCDKKFLKDPAKYAPNLESQGIQIDPKKVEVAPDMKDVSKDGAGKGHDDSHSHHEGHHHGHSGGGH